MSFISARGVSKVFGGPPGAVVALDGVCLDIQKGDFVAVTGPSGSGKTTLLSILGAMTPPTSGEVTVGGVSLYSLTPDGLADFRAGNVGFVFQQLYLLPYLTAIQNVMLPLVISPAEESAWDVAARTLRDVGMEDKAGRLPGELSSGEQARVAIARALVKSPPIVLADEPTGNLDSRTGQDIVRLLQSASERGHTVIVVTHNREVASAARRSIHLRDGRVVTAGE